MGERSQIYVRHEGKLILARYYPWNHSDGMISRARYGIEHIKCDVDNGYTFCFVEDYYINRYIRIFDTDFDRKDVTISTDIFKEFEDWQKEDPALDFGQFCFIEQDNNDGKLLIDIVGKTIKYAFLDDTTDLTHIMTARQYMDWNTANWEFPDWENYLDDLSIRNGQPVNWVSLCEDNIKEIESMAQLMTEQEVIEYLNTDGYYGKPTTE